MTSTFIFFATNYAKLPCTNFQRLDTIFHSSFLLAALAGLQLTIGSFSISSASALPLLLLVVGNRTRGMLMVTMIQIRPSSFSVKWRLNQHSHMFMFWNNVVLHVFREYELFTKQWKEREQNGPIGQFGRTTPSLAAIGLASPSINPNDKVKKYT